MKYSVLGAGNGGQAIAGYLGINGYSVKLFDRNKSKVEILSSIGGITLEGCINGFGKFDCVTSILDEAVRNTDIIMITTVANAHKDLAQQLAPILVDEQIIILNPGRTCGALEFKQTLLQCGCNKRVYIAEAQTLVYACRIKEQGIVNIIGVKSDVLLSALPSSDTPHVINAVTSVYPCFSPASNVLRTSLENIGAILHPCVILFNAATIERGNQFYFYRDMTPNIAAFIEQFDAERLSVGRAYGIDLLSVSEWVSYAYKGIKGDDFCEKIKNNPAYYDILAPTSIYTRQLMEDLPTGVQPIYELGVVAGLEMPLFRSMVEICSRLLNIDFINEGRSLKSLGLDGLSKEEIINIIN